MLIIIIDIPVRLKQNFYLICVHILEFQLYPGEFATKIQFLCFYCVNYNISNQIGIDRIDSSIDYLEDNVQWVHKDVNRMKLEFSVKYLRYLCTLIYLKAQNENNDYSI